MTRVLVAILRAWQAVSVWLPPMCRFYPSCSRYAVEALQVHGPFRGTWLAILRVLRCHPLHPGGLDPVPPRRSLQAADPTGGCP